MNQYVSCVRKNKNKKFSQSINHMNVSYIFNMHKTRIKVWKRERFVFKPNILKNTTFYMHKKIISDLIPETVSQI